MNTELAARLTAALEKIDAYAKTAPDIATWDAEEISSLLVDVQFIVNDNTDSPPHVADDDARRQAILKLVPGHADAEDLQIDEDALVSEGDDNGAYVQAWVWVSFEGTPFDKEPGA